MVVRSRPWDAVENMARHSTATPVIKSAAATMPRTSESNRAPALRSMIWSAHTPAIVDGMLPTPSQSEIPMSTAPLRKCIHPPTVFVTAA